tara:strand:- start:663 stop:869 length:207 start_codon:yes stop_codon:yes gene_type:complete
MFGSLDEISAAGRREVVDYLERMGCRLGDHACYSLDALKLIAYEAFEQDEAENWDSDEMYEWTYGGCE